LRWWEEAEARARRTPSPAGLAQTLWQRLKEAGVDPDLSFLPAHDLAALYFLCLDLVRLVEAILVAADGDGAELRRQVMALWRWSERARQWAHGSAPAFNQLVDSLDLDPEEVALREEVEPAVPQFSPEEQPKLEGRYEYWHLLYERLDLKYASLGVEEQVHRGLAHSVARIYEAALHLIRNLTALEKDPRPRYGQVARLLLDINTTWHFDLGPYHLGHGQMLPRGGAVVGLQTWLLRVLAG